MAMVTICAIIEETSIGIEDRTGGEERNELAGLRKLTIVSNGDRRGK